MFRWMSCPVCGHHLKVEVDRWLEKVECSGCGANVAPNDCGSVEGHAPPPTATASAGPVAPSPTSANPASANASAWGPPTHPYAASTSETPHPDAYDPGLPPLPRYEEPHLPKKQTPGMAESWFWGPGNGVVSGILGILFGGVTLTAKFVMLGTLSTWGAVMFGMGVLLIVRGVAATQSRIASGESIGDQLLLDLKRWAIQAVVVLILFGLIGGAILWAYLSMQNVGNAVTGSPY